MKEAKRYSPRTILYDVCTFFKSMFFLYIFVYVFNWDSTTLLLTIGRYAGILLPVFTVLFSTAVWFTHKYQLDDTSCYTYSGIFNRKTQAIPLHKIQNMNEEQNFLHKLLRVTTLNCDTAASGPDATLSFRVISLTEAERIRQLVLKAKHVHDISLNPAEPVTEDLEHQYAKPSHQGSSQKRTATVHFQPTRKDTIKASFTSFSFLLVFPVIITVYKYISDTVNIDHIMSKWMRELLDRPILLSVIIIAAILLGILLGMMKTHLQYGKFEISSDEDTIFIRKGILNETSFSVSKARVQAVKIEQSFLKRILGIAEVQLITAGGSLLDSDRMELNKLYPFFPKKRAYEIVHTLLPTYTIQEQMNALPKNALRLKLLRPSWLWIGLTIYLVYKRPIFLTIPYSWLWIIILTALMIISSRILQFKHAGYAFNHQFIQIQTGGFSRKLVVTKRNRVIEVSVKRSFLQRQFKVASIHITNRGAPIHIETIEDIAEQDGTRFLQWYQARINEVIFDQKET